jgi:hypothetical protein
MRSQQIRFFKSSFFYATASCALLSAIIISISNPKHKIIVGQEAISFSSITDNQVYAERSPKASPQNKKQPEFVPFGYIDTRIRAGNGRSLGSSEIFYPFSWNGKFLGFTDIRLTAATDSTIEGNAGLGIRRINGNRTGIFGLYGYLDQRKSRYDNQFTQMTLGTEWLTPEWEARLNTYLPLSGKKTKLEAAVTSFSIIGTGLVATGGNNIIIETPNYGLDLEFGKRIPIVEYDYIKDVWFYVGAYYFDSDETQSIQGYRLRTKLDVTDRLSIGAEWRQDNIRDDEMLIEARLRFPFNENEKSALIKPTGIYSKLMQQPVRDVDIVVQDSKKSETSSSAILNSENGNQQKILTVDNTASAGGDGSSASPYNSLAVAQAAAAPGDIIYVAYGDGTSTGMNSGLTLNQDGQSLIGSGVDLKYDSSRMSLSGAGFSIPDGTVIVRKGLSPILTNLTAASDILTISADDVLVSGVTLSSATRHGLNLTISGAGNDITGAIIQDVNIVTPNNNGINVSATASAIIDRLTVDRVSVDNSGALGLSLNANGSNSTISNFSLKNSNILNSHTNGFQGISIAGGDITNSNISGTDFEAAGDSGIYFQATGAGSTLIDLTIDDVTINDSGLNGIYLLGQNTASMSNISILDTSIESAGDNGIYTLLQNTGTQLSGLSITDSNVSGSATTGIYLQAQAGTTVTNSTFSDLILDDNRDNGMNIFSTGVGTSISQTSLSNITAKNSGMTGVTLQATTSGSLTDTSVDNLISTGNSSHGLYVFSNAGTAVIDNLTIQNSEFNDNRANGIYVQNASAGTMTDISFQGIKIDDSSDTGMLVSSTNTGSLINGLDLSNVVISDAGSTGLNISALTAGQITNTNLEDIKITNSGQNGLALLAAGASATINNISLTNTTINDAGASGALVQATTTGRINQLSFIGLKILDPSDNGLYLNTQAAGSQITNFTVDDLEVKGASANSGVYLYAQSGSLMQNGTLTDLSIDGVGEAGINLLSETTATLMNNIQISDATINDSGFDGLRLSSTAGGDMTNIDVSDLSITNSGENGVYLFSTATGSIISGVTLSDITVTGSAAVGVYIQGATNGQLSVALNNVTSSANYDNGVYINDDTTSSFTVDMGGGTLGSTGGNRIFNNYLQEMRLDYDGANMFANNNWWGNSLGLITTERTLEVSSTIDTTGFLTSDPGP